MALLAGDLFMRSVQGKARLTVIEAFEIFPGIRLMATFTLPGQLPFMFILMACRTFPRQSQVGASQVLYRNITSGRSRNVRRLMAYFAGDLGMPPLQAISGFLMIKPA
jgi:hypothetical protein